MAKNALLILLSAVCACLPGFAQNESSRQRVAWRKPDQLVRALALKRSDVVAVLEPEPFVAPLIADRVRTAVNFDDPATPAQSVDVIVLYDALHRVERRGEFYPRLRHLLRPGGRVVNVDLSSELPQPQAVQEFTAGGFHIIESVGFSPLQYLLVFE